MHVTAYYDAKIEDIWAFPLFKIQQIPCLFCRNCFIFNFFTRHDRRRPREDGLTARYTPLELTKSKFDWFRLCIFSTKGKSNFHKYSCFVCFGICVWHVHSRKIELRQNVKHVSWFDIQHMTTHAGILLFHMKSWWSGKMHNSTAYPFIRYLLTFFSPNNGITKSRLEHFQMKGWRMNAPNKHFQKLQEDLPTTTR